MDLAKITILENHRVQTGSVAPLAISIDGQNGVDELAFEVPKGMEDWAWRVEIEQGGKKTWRLLDAGNVWAIRAGEVAEGYARMQLVGSRTSGEDAEVWKSREFDVNVLPAINAAEAMEPGEASEFDRIAAEVKGDADRADAAAIRAEDAAAGAENIVNMAISDIEAEGQKQAAAVASSGTQALEAIGQVEQTAIAQVQAAGTAQVGAVEDAGDGKLAEIDAANAHVPQINETTGKWQVWDAQTGAYVDTDTDAQGPRGETGATGPQGPAGADGIGLPVATAEDAGKVPVVSADGNYTLGEPVPEVDATLTEAGAPADAAAVGEAIEAISPDDAAVDGKPWTSQHIVDMLCPPLEASGNPVQCYPVAGYPLGVKATWQPRQAGTGDPSPDNIRAISGMESVTVTACGTSLFDFYSMIPETATLNGITADKLPDGRIHVHGTNTNDGFTNVVHIAIPKGQRPTFPAGAYSVGSKFIVGTNLGNKVGSFYAAEQMTATYFYISVAANATVDFYAIPMLVAGDVPSIAYEPYTGTAATLSLPSTVYGGTVDAVTGEGTEAWECLTLDNPDLVNMNDGKNFFYTTLEAIFGPDSPRPIDPISTADFIASNLKATINVGNDATGFAFALYSNGIIRFHVDGVTTLEEAKQFVVDNPITIAYRLATPNTISTTPNTVLAISGLNTIYTDADSLTVTGRADPVATVQALADRVAALEQAAVN